MTIYMQNPYNNPALQDSGALGEVFLFFIIVYVIIFFVSIFFLYFIALWRLYDKAGEPGWTAIIPIYNTIVFIKIANRPLWWFILCLIPLVNIVIFMILTIDFIKAYGKTSTGSIALAILFSPFYIPIIGLSSETEYVGLRNGDKEKKDKENANQVPYF